MTMSAFLRFCAAAFSEFLSPLGLMASVAVG
jgi:hypothetical protein